MIFSCDSSIIEALFKTSSIRICTVSMNNVMLSVMFMNKLIQDAEMFDWITLVSSRFDKI